MQISPAVSALLEKVGTTLAEVRDVSELDHRLRSLRRTVAAELAAAPALQRYRLSGPVAAGLLPMEQWNTDTALTWFDESFAWSDLYRDEFRCHQL